MKKVVRQVGNLQRLYQYARSTERKIVIFLLVGVCQPDAQLPTW